MTHWQCRKLYEYALKLGILVRPKICSKCGLSSEWTIQGHHTDYEKPLEVMWLCIDCHRIEDHKNLRLPGYF